MSGIDLLSSMTFAAAQIDWSNIKAACDLQPIVLSYIAFMGKRLYI